LTKRFYDVVGRLARWRIGRAGRIHAGQITLAQQADKLPGPHAADGRCRRHGRGGGKIGKSKRRSINSSHTMMLHSEKVRRRVGAFANTSPHTGLGLGATKIGYRRSWVYFYHRPKAWADSTFKP